MAKVKCPCGAKIRDKRFTLCNSCLESTGAEFVSSKYDLEGLSWEERAIVLMVAAGKSEYLDAILDAHAARVARDSHDGIYSVLKRFRVFRHPY